jgi:predicted RecA/RadA family phage recombinase
VNNYSQPGNILTLIADRAITSGGGFLKGAIFGVATAAVADAAAGEFVTCGVFSLTKTSAQAWTVGQKIYWDNTLFVCTTDGTAGQLIGTATAVADNPSSTGYVKLNDAAPSSSEGPQAAVADLTDNSGGAVADGTIAIVTPSTALTDNGGGTADGTVASQAAPVTLTDSTSFSGTHDDTLAAVTVPVDLTGGEDPTEAEFNALLAVIRVIGQNQSDTAQKVIELVTLGGVAQANLKEITTSLAADRTAIVALTDAVKELSTKLNTTLARLRLAGVIAS